MSKTKTNLIPAASFLLVVTLVSASIVVTARMKVEPIQRRVQVVHFTLYDTGIYPQEARAYPGRVTIAIEDLTGSSSGLIVERVDASARLPVGVVAKATNLLRTRTELLLPEGRYELADATRGDNRALLIVEP